MMAGADQELGARIKRRLEEWTGIATHCRQLLGERDLDAFTDAMRELQRAFRDLQELAGNVIDPARRGAAGEAAGAALAEAQTLIDELSEWRAERDENRHAKARTARLRRAYASAGTGSGPSALQVEKLAPSRRGRTSPPTAHTRAEPGKGTPDGA